MTPARLQTAPFADMLRARSRRNACMPSKRSANAVKLAEPPVASATFKKFFQDMMLIRRFEERASQMYGMRLIGGVCPLYIWQGAGGVGGQAGLQEGGSLITPQPEHRPTVARRIETQRGVGGPTGR